MFFSMFAFGYQWYLQLKQIYRYLHTLYKKRHPIFPTDSKSNNVFFCVLGLLGLQEYHKFKDGTLFLQVFNYYFYHMKWVKFVVLASTTLQKFAGFPLKDPV